MPGICCHKDVESDSIKSPPTLSMKTSSDIIVVAAGSGKRMNIGFNKMYLEIDGVPLLYRTLYRLENARAINRIIVTIREGEMRQYEQMMNRHGMLDKITAIVYGGRTRSDSVRSGLHYLRGHRPSDIILIHDGARPFITTDLISRLIDAATKLGAAIPVIAVSDTVRQKNQERTKVIDRSSLYFTQTPQAFRREMIEPCFFSEAQSALHLTDDAAYIEEKGYHVEMVEGEKSNIKITNREDIAWAEYLLVKYATWNIARQDICP